MLAQGVAELAHGLTALRSGQGSPMQERFVGPSDDTVVFICCDLSDRGDGLAVDRRHTGDQFAATDPLAGEPTRIV